MSNLKSLIPKGFYNGLSKTPTANTVGELMAQLRKLPPDLPLSGWPERFTHEIVVCNISYQNPHLIISEVDVNE